MVTGHRVFSQQLLQLSLRFLLEAQSLMLDDVLEVSNPATNCQLLVSIDFH